MDGHAASAPRPVHRDAVARALRTWRRAEEALAHPVLAPDRAHYERAVGTVLAQLRRFDTVDELVRYYAWARLRLHAAVRAACRGPDDARLLTSVVEGTAF